MKYRVDLKSLKTEIERKGFQSVEELSEKSRINERELTLVLDGKNLPAMDIMVELASALELTPEKANEIFFNRIIRNTYKKERHFGDGKKGF
ncbi:XRE family transcriptional regulator [Eisenbergiella porci]|uniref:XRE family transcriptional regulator n=1 Tax=Eisenbergiella porci TaxID=2652274 RepID=UPI002A840AD7|nr:XRE family transcriptional regulator [Eisenbergiella porci]